MMGEVVYPAFVLARHGQSALNQTAKNHNTRVVQGQSPSTPLTKHGEMQAGQFGRKLKAYIRDGVVLGVHSSTADRAIDTAKIALQSAGLKNDIIESPKLLEVHKGKLEGQPYAQAYPTQAHEEQKKTDWNFRYQGGETIFEAGKRWARWFKEISQDYENREGFVLVFGHNTITAAGVYLLTNPGVKIEPGTQRNLEEDISPFKVGNGKALVVKYNNGAWRVDHGRIG